MPNAKKQTQLPKPYPSFITARLGRDLGRAAARLSLSYEAPTQERAEALAEEAREIVRATLTHWDDFPRYSHRALALALLLNSHLEAVPHGAIVAPFEEIFL